MPFHSPNSKFKNNWIDKWKHISLLVGVVLIWLSHSSKDRMKNRSGAFVIYSKMLFFVFNLILLFYKTHPFLISMKNNHVYIECGRSIIIKNHYWFLTDFLNLLKSFNSSHSINEQLIPFEHLYLIFNHILIHCQQAHQSYQINKKKQNIDELYRWFRTQIKN